MGSRKKDSALARKVANNDVVKARLNDCPSSPRKMRLVADIIRGEKVDKALYILKYSKKDASNKWKNYFFLPLPTGKAKMKGQTSKKQILS